MYFHIFLVFSRKPAYIHSIFFEKYQQQKQKNLIFICIYSIFFYFAFKNIVKILHFFHIYKGQTNFKSILSLFKQIAVYIYIFFLCTSS